MTEQPLSIAQHYHDRTKYDPDTLGAKSHQLDWENQPVPFKEYKIGATIDLKPYLKKGPEGGKDVARKGLTRLSRLLFCTYGLTAKLATMTGSQIYLRSAPSAGGLYPAELYLISKGTPQLPPGLYNYQARNHSLIRFWDSDVWPALQAATFWHPALEHTKLAIATSAVFFRSAWRYQDRAYRRIFLDTGHLLGNLELAASLTDYRPHPIAGFHDDALNELLYLDPSQESLITFIPLADLLDIDQNLPKYRTALPSDTQTDYPTIPDGELLGYCHEVTKINSDKTGIGGWSLSDQEESEEDKYNFPFCSKVSTKTRPIDWRTNLEGLENTILKRRSTRAYSGAPLSFDELKALLDFTYHSEHYTYQNLDAFPDFFDLEDIQTFIAVSSVTGLDEGCYYYAPKAEELRQVRFKNFRRELHYLCLGQDLGRDASALVFHTADLKKAIAKYGDRVYRYLHLDAGHLGQRLNLGAIYMGLGVSGIGGFFDDRVNEVLGIPADEAVLYITTLGQPR
ncbi:SagB/ThcOx family dehydrogenase [Laspinema sp. D1]|uniref:SagB/ThcOx family dehydrogenase n=1 Tax=Laspinema palackyanum TaxID=3231601 RepID=UPI003495B966|nr:SagB/ThcOx family dehydrogenase [Laspinema sp. D2b]